MVTVAVLLPPFMQKITNKLPAVVLRGTVMEVFPLAEKFWAAWTTEKGGGTRLVSEKFTVVSPVAIAVTGYGPPAVAFAVKGADATPDAFVATMIVAVLLLNTPEAPDPGAVNVTFTPVTGLPPLSFTVTAKGFAKAVLIVADCGVVPAFAVIVDGAPAVLVSEKLAEVAPVAEAITV
jgi:hypothetical protein